MAVDTADKRGSAINVGSPWRQTLPLPGTIAQGDRQQLARMYSGILADGSASLVIADASHAHTADALTLTTSSALAVADATQAHTADNVTLALGGAVLVVADALHDHTADNLTLTIVPGLVIQDALHAHTADGVTLGGDFPATPTLSGGGSGYSARKPLLERQKRRRAQEEAEAQEIAQALIALIVSGVLH